MRASCLVRIVGGRAMQINRPLTFGCQASCRWKGSKRRALGATCGVTIAGLGPMPVGERMKECSTSRIYGSIIECFPVFVIQPSQQLVRSLEFWR
jgi:hypothetical protein